MGSFGLSLRIVSGSRGCRQDRPLVVSTVQVPGSLFKLGEGNSALELLETAEATIEFVKGATPALIIIWPQGNF